VDAEALVPIGTRGLYIEDRGSVAVPLVTARKIRCGPRVPGSGHPRDTVTRLPVQWTDGSETYGVDVRLVPQSLRDGRAYPRFGVDPRLGESLDWKCLYGDTEVCPPLEFLLDTQDVLGMFLGRKRYSDVGCHLDLFSQAPEDPERSLLLERLAGYAYSAELVHQRIWPLDPSKILASRFLLAYYSDGSTTMKKRGKQIGSYNLQSTGEGASGGSPYSDATEREGNDGEKKLKGNGEYFFM
jgi:hypothetical protein